VTMVNEIATVRFYNGLLNGADGITFRLSDGLESAAVTVPLSYGNFSPPSIVFCLTTLW
jgi:hypothetical protein